MPIVSGCSSVRLAYNNGSQLLWWWVDGYFDFNREQERTLRPAIDQLFEWHRSTQLAELIPLLANAQSQVLSPITPASACRLQDQVRDKLDATLERTLALAADVVPILTEPQFKHLEKRYAKSIAEMREDFLQPDPAVRQRESVKRAIERAERLYGSLDAAQKRVISAGIAASPFDPELWLAERLRRQRETLQVLRRLAVEKPDREQRQAALRQLITKLENSPDADYRAYQQRLGEFNCAFASHIHNATTPAQRRHGREILKGWEDDLRSLIGPA